MARSGPQRTSPRPRLTAAAYAEGNEHVAFNSCSSRHCPSCLGHKSARWLEARADELLPVPYFHDSAPQTLLHHPHIHCVVPGGGLSPDRTRWIGCRDNFFLPVKVLSRLFRGKSLALLDAAAKRGALRFAGSTASLADPRTWTSLLRQMHRKDWVVYTKPPFGSPEQVLKYLARYTHRVVISNRRIASLTTEHVIFRYRDHAHGCSIQSP